MLTYINEESDRVKDTKVNRNNRKKASMAAGLEKLLVICFNYNYKYNHNLKFSITIIQVQVIVMQLQFQLQLQ